MRSIHKNVPELFEPHGWTVTETEWKKENNKNNETIFTVANGYLGIRGFIEEGFCGDAEYSDRTSMLNGVYEYFPYRHIWCRPGFPERYHAIVNQADPFDIKVFADGEPVRICEPSKIKDYSRTLDMKTGTVERKFVFITQSGKNVSLSLTRFALQHNKHVALNKITVACDKDAEIKIESALSAPRGCGAAKEEIGGASGEIFDFLGRERRSAVKLVRYKTKVAKFEIAAAALDVLNVSAKTEAEDSDCGLKDIYSFSLKAGESAELVRCVAYVTNRDCKKYAEEAEKHASGAAKRGFAAELAASAEKLGEFWENADIQIDSDEAVQQGLRFSALQIFQSTGKDGITNISANGLSGTGYSGHTFWDTEVFMMPMYIYSSPQIAKQLISYRYNILDKARERAKQMDDDGALFSWNSINGEECGHVFEAVTAQYHINNDVFYAIYRYYEATGDKEFLFDKCAEILFEISRCMAHRGAFIPTKGNKFCINVICGPDEYNPVVDNNLYTNVLTQKQLRFTLKVAEMLKKERPKQYAELAEKCGVTNEEMALWKRAADNMYIPFSKELGIYMQDDNFIYKDPIDVDSIPREKLPLLTHLHPLNLWRYQVCKQADIVLLAFICSDYFTKEERKKIFEYYEPKTIHDSSLSASIHSIVACDVGDKADAYGYLRQASRMDLDNVNGNTFFGLHAACMGASWMMMVNGYAGLRIYDEKLHFEPFIHDGWNSYSFKLLFRGVRLRVTVTKQNTVYEILSGGAITLSHNGKDITIKGKTVV